MSKTLPQLILNKSNFVYLWCNIHVPYKIYVMTKKISFLLFVLFSMQGYAQTGIGTTTPHASAKLDVTSTNKGFLPPRMTALQRVEIPTPAAGLMVYQTDGIAGLYYYSGSAWIYIINSTSNVLPVANGGTGTNTSTGTGSVVLNTSPTLVSPNISSGGAIFLGSSSGSTTFKASAVAGTTTITLPAQTGTVALYSDILSEPNWTSVGTIQSVGWSATTTAPTIGTTTVNDYSYKQIGPNTYRCQLTYSSDGSATGANNGSGDYLFTLPNGLQFNTALAGQATYTLEVGSNSWTWSRLWLSNSSGSITNLSQGGLLYVVPYNSTQFRLIHVGIAGVGFVIPYASGYYGVGSNISWRATFTFQSL